MTAEEAAIAAPRTLPDEDVRAAIVESDISFYRNPDCVTSRRANECERALDEQWGFVRGETAYRYEQFYAGSEFPKGTFNRVAGRCDIHPGAFDKVFQDNLNMGRLGDHREWYGRKRPGALRPANF